MIDLSRYNVLADIQKVSLLTFDEQEEMVVISTKILYEMMDKNKEIFIRLKKC